MVHAIYFYLAIIALSIGAVASYINTYALIRSAVAAREGGGATACGGAETPRFPTSSALGQFTRASPDH